MKRYLIVFIAIVIPVSVTSDNAEYRPPRVESLFTHNPTSDLLLINGNTWLVPLYAGGHRDRLDAISAYIHDLPVLPHVVTLQEVWLKKRVHLIKRLFPGYNAYTSGRFRRVVGMSVNESGLMTLVRRDLVVSEVSYTLIADEMLVKVNRRVGKGSLATSIEHAGHTFRIVNVHLPNTFDGRFLSTTKASLESLEIEGIIAGDLNLEPHQLPSGYFVGNLEPTFGNDALGRVRDRQIDYVLSDETTAVESMVITDPTGRCLPFSDHCFLAARLSPRSQVDSPPDERIDARHGFGGVSELDGRTDRLIPIPHTNLTPPVFNDVRTGFTADGLR
jgi:endonuclease/exonuclease/phosphatase family metal-dependent hydrolase